MSRRHADLQKVGRLAEALRHPDRDVVAQAEAALTILLPQLKTDDAGLLSAEQRECLYSVIQVRNISGKSDLLVAVLGALERVGDVQALPAVAALASRQVDSSAGRRVKTAAESCLQVLREIDALNDPQQSLLRASEAAVGTTDTLLRPVFGDTGSPETMVRPATWRSDDKPEELLRSQDVD